MRGIFVLRCGALEIEWAVLESKLHWSELKALNWMVAIRQQKKDLIHESGGLALFNFGDKGCCDPRDAVYALRSLALNLMSVVPDYSLRTVDVFTTATRVILRNSENMALLDTIM